jgi:hypothetical protein
VAYVFMGLSLPLLSRIVTDHPDISAARIGGLYGWNTLGAALGALSTVWLLVRAWGFDGAILVGAALNGACAAAALAIAGTSRGRQVVRFDDGAGPAGATASGARWPGLSLRVWLLLYALSGFVALLEILWFRMLASS